MCATQSSPVDSHGLSDAEGLTTDGTEVGDGEGEAVLGNESIISDYMYVQDSGPASE